MYSIEELKELLSAFDGSKATALDIQFSENEFISLRQKTGKVICQETVPAAAAAEAQPEIYHSAAGTMAEDSVPDGDPVESPMVGVFYSAPSPESEPYVSVGSSVKKGDVLCLIEAMKLMNEVTAEKNGMVTKVCVENGQVVEYGQPLFIIK